LYYKFLRPSPPFSEEEMQALHLPRLCAPFSTAQVERLRQFQTGGTIRPYQCCYRDMVPMGCGLVCAVCDRVQEWAHSFAADGPTIHG
jgi:hypothetical protein